MPSLRIDLCKPNLGLLWILDGRLRPQFTSGHSPSCSELRILPKTRMTYDSLPASWSKRGTKEDGGREAVRRLGQISLDMLEVPRNPVRDPHQDAHDGKTGDKQVPPHSVAGRAHHDKNQRQNVDDQYGEGDGNLPLRKKAPPDGLRESETEQEYGE